MTSGKTDVFTAVHRQTGFEPTYTDYEKTLHNVMDELEEKVLKGLEVVAS